MSIQGSKIVNLTDAQVLYNDTRDRIGTLRDATLVVETETGPEDIISITDGAAYPMRLTAEIDPVQDLHGYDHPWPGGGGKNLYNNEVGSLTTNEVTFTKNNDGTISLSGTATSNAYYNMSNRVLPAGTYIANGCPANGSQNTYALNINDVTTGTVISEGDIGSGKEFTTNGSDEYQLYIRIASGTNTNGLVFKPMIRLATVSDATYAPYSNICPISGFDGANVTVTGKNLFKFGVTAVDKTAEYRPNTAQRLYISEESNGDLKFSYRGSNWSTACIQIDGIDGTEDYAFSFEVVSNTTSYTPEIIKDGSRSTEKHLVIAINGGNGNTSVSSDNYFILTKIQVEKGTTATAYEPSSGTVYPITFPTSAGTVYGGTVTVNPDGTGELVVDRVKVVASDLTWQKHSTHENHIYYTNTLQQLIKRPHDGYTVPESLVAEFTYPCAWEYMFIAGRTGMSIATTGLLGVAMPTISTIEDFVSAVGGYYICYPLATPATYTLSSPQVLSLLGQNNIWADTGPILSAQIPRNTKLYIDKRLAELQEAIANS